MLVLSRKVGERILVGDQIRITVVRLTNGGVRIGIEAPDEMPVLREEVKRQSEMSSVATVGGSASSGPLRRRPK
jgi:carbon storage regulator